MPYREGLRMSIICECEMTGVGVLTFRDAYLPYKAEGCPIIIHFLTPMGDTDLEVRVSYVDKNDVARTVDITLDDTLRLDDHWFFPVGDIVTGWVKDITNVTILAGGSVGDKFEILSLDGYIGRLLATVAAQIETHAIEQKEALEQRFFELVTLAGLIQWGADLGVGRRTGWTLAKWTRFLKLYRQFFEPTPSNIKDLIDELDEITYDHVYELHDGPYYLEGGLYDTWLLMAGVDMPTSYEIQRVMGYGSLTLDEMALVLNLISPVSTHWEITYPIPQDADDWTDTYFKNYEEQVLEDADLTPIRNTTSNAGQTVSDVRNTANVVVKARKEVNTFTPTYDYYRDETLTESNAVTRTGEMVTVSLSSIDSGKCFSDSPRIFQPDTDTGVEIDSQVHNGVYDTFDTDHNFLSSTDRADPTGWVVFVEDANTDARVLPYFQRHKKVLELYDNNGAGKVWVHDNLPSQPAFGTIECWFRTDDSTKTTYYTIYEGAMAATSIELLVDGGFLKVNQGGLVNIVAIANDTWYHIKITFDCTAGGYDGLAEDKFYIYVTPEYGSTTRYGPPYDMENTPTDWLGNVTIRSDDADSGYSSFWDAFDYSWEAGWYDGRNKFLTDFDISFLADVGASSSKVYRIYYDAQTQGDPGYTGISRAGNQVTCSDNTEYNFTASTATSFMDIVQKDKNAVDWCLYGGSYNIISGLLDAATAPIWLEDGAIFSECSYYESSNEYVFYRIHDNNLISETLKADAVTSVIYYHDWDVGGTFVEHVRFEQSGWKSLAVGAGLVDDTLTSGKIFFDDTDDKQVIYAWVYAMTDESKLIRSFTDQADRCAVNIGRDVGAHKLLANTEYVFWHGFRDAGSTAAGDKEDYVDDLYTEVISDPLSQSLGAEDSEDTITALITDLVLELYEWDTDYATSIAGAVLATASVAVGAIGAVFGEITFALPAVVLDETKTYLMHFYTVGGNGASDPPGKENMYELRYKTGNPYAKGIGYRNGVALP